MRSNKDICLICSFLPFNDEYYNLWESINHNLKSKNIEFILLTSMQSINQNVSFPIIQVPIFLDKFNEVFEFEKYTTSEIDKDDLLLIERDIFWNNVNIENYLEHYLGYLKCLEFYEQLIEYINPAIVFIWGNYLPQSEIFKKLLDRNKIPNFYLERGYLTGTIMIENLLNDNLKRGCENIELTEYHHKVYNEISNFYLKTNIAKYSFNTDRVIENYIQKASTTKKIISFFPNPDFALFPREHQLSKEISPIFASHIEMSNVLADIVNSSENLFLVIKTHPLDKIERYKHLESNKIVVTDKIYFRNLFQYSNLLVFTTTTLQFEALFFNKPIVLLTNSSLVYSNVPYIIQSKQNIIDTIKYALNDSDRLNREENTKKFVIRLLEDFIYFYIKDIKVGKNIEDFCNFIEQKIESINKNKNIPTLNRLITFQGYLNSHLKINSSLHRIVLPSLPNISYEISEHFKIIKKKMREYYEPIRVYIEKKIEQGKLYNAEQILKKLNGVLLNDDKAKLLNELLVKRENLKEKYKWSSKKSANFLIESESLIEKNKLNEAEEKIIRLLNFESDHVEALNDLAVVYVLKGEFLQAKILLERILESDPDNQIAKENLQYIYENT